MSFHSYFYSLPSLNVALPAVFSLVRAFPRFCALLVVAVVASLRPPRRDPPDPRGASLGGVDFRGNSHPQHVAALLGAGARHGGILLGLLRSRGAPDRPPHDDDARHPRGVRLGAGLRARGAPPAGERSALQRGAIGRFLPASDSPKCCATSSRSSAFSSPSSAASPRRTPRSAGIASAPPAVASASSAAPATPSSPRFCCTARAAAARSPARCDFSATRGDAAPSAAPATSRSPRGEKAPRWWSGRRSPRPESR